MLSKKKLLLSVLLLWSCLLWAQLPNDLHFQRYSTHEGLSDNYVFNVVEDRQHFIWVATFQGVDRLDGVEVRHYSLIDSSKTDAQPTTEVLIDYKGSIWAIRNANLFKYNPTQDRFELKSHTKSKEFNALNNKVKQKFAVLNDIPNQCFWIARENGLFRYQIETGRLESTPIRSFSTPYKIISINATTLIVATNEEWISYDTLTKKSFRIPKPATEWVIYATKANHWIYSDEGRRIWEISFQNSQFTRPVLTEINPQRKEIRSITTLPNQTGPKVLWCGLVTGGLALLDPENKNAYQRFNDRINELNGLHYRRILNIYQDSTHNIWLSTDQGLYRANPTKFQIQKELFPFFRKLNISRVRQIVQHASESHLEWIANSNYGLFLYDKVHQKIIKSFEMPGSGITQIKYDRYGRLWVLSAKKLTIIDPQLRIKTIPTVHLKPDLLCWRIIFDRYNNAWIGSEIGLLKVAFPTQKITVYAPVITDPQSISHAFVYDLKWLNHQNIALATRNGVDIFDINTEKVTKKIGPRQNVFALDIDSTETMWVAFSNEFIKISNHQVVKSWKSYGNNRSLRFKNGLTVDKSGKLWMNTNDGLLNFDPVTEKFQLFTENDGLISNYFYGFIYENNGNLYLNYEEGVNYFDPLQAHTTPKINKALLTDFSLLDERQAINFWNPQSPFKVNYDQNIITFRYAVVEFDHPEKITFRYQLEGFDKSWKNGNTRRDVSYTNLSGGHYTFRVQALRTDGNADSNIAEFRIFLTTPYYQSWWFFGLLFCGITSFFYSLYRYRLKQILKLQHLRNSISRDLHDEVGSTLSSITMLSESAKKSIDIDQAQTRKFMESITTNAQKVLESMDDIVWAINPKDDSLESIVLRIKEYAYTLTETKDIYLRFDIDPRLQKLKVPMKIRRNLYLILKESINNAVKHSGCNELKITLKTENRALNMVIQDNGQGFDPLKPSLRNGLENMRQRAIEFGGEIRIESQKNKGTTIYIKMDS
ncbi:sensor histidine kinase [Runella salmonicolor]|uniref:histidine kinase n=1 Tax=Runella salmonicolor TaxID=2950278 RepID=A0ABT1FJM8_9BACT|nr:sensor histidine kinase [Runella salmonicolor]MCP1381974.1 histidine kinase [Runella salmonicolor]